MPLKLYEKDQILDACFSVFIENGYGKTSTAMLSEAAGISKALLFHHFKSKKALYMNILERCFDRMAKEYNEESLLDYDDYFQAKIESGQNKINYLRQNPDIAKLLYEAYVLTPEDLKADMPQFAAHIKIKYGSVENERNQTLRRLFEAVPIKKTLDQDEAYELIGVVDDFFRRKIAADLTDVIKLHDDAYWEKLLSKKKKMLEMVRYGIQEKGR